MDMAVTHIGVIKQHLIDPEICIRCNTCEATCPVGAITHDDRNYVVRADVCNLCMACISPCPTGSIDNWRTMPVAKAYSIEEQLTWDELPAELTPEQLEAEGAGAPVELPPQQAALATAAEQITEPEPGRVLVESDLDREAVTRFVVEPVRDDGRERSRVTISTDWSAPGPRGWIERLVAPAVLRRIYAEELRNLEAAARSAAARARS